LKRCTPKTTPKMILTNVKGISKVIYKPVAKEPNLQASHNCAARVELATRQRDLIRTLGVLNNPRKTPRKSSKQTQIRAHLAQGWLGQHLVRKGSGLESKMRVCGRTESASWLQGPPRTQRAAPLITVWGLERTKPRPQNRQPRLASFSYDVHTWGSSGVRHVMCSFCLLSLNDYYYMFKPQPPPPRRDCS
jgi:hypothetical protein